MPSVNPNKDQTDASNRRETHTKPLITIACCMPVQLHNRQDKLQWLQEALDKTDCDLFLVPQEFIGGHYATKEDLHVERNWLTDHIGALARTRKRHIGVGACVKDSTNSGAMESYYYFDDTGEVLGQHSKFALPSYDDVRASGHGNLWPETSFNKRTMPIDLPKLRLRVGTIFCWEVFSQAIWPAYSIAGVNFVAHPIKFAPRGWLKNKKQSDGKLHIVGFGNAPKSQIWIDRLLMASRHQVMCPIGVSCNSWNLGPKYLALVGHVDEFCKTTKLHDVPSIGTEEIIHTFKILPEFYTGLDHHHSAGAFKAHVGSVDGYSEMGEYTMHGKIRRLESHLIGGTTLLDCQLKASAAQRQKKSTLKRALGVGTQTIGKPPK